MMARTRSLNVEVQRSFLTMINVVRRSELKSFARPVIEPAYGRKAKRLPPYEVIELATFGG